MTMQSPMTPDKAHKLNAIYRAMPYDYKSILDGYKAILLYCGGAGTCLVRLIDLDDNEIERLLPRDYYGKQ
jgi:hypothetical protein